MEHGGICEEANRSDLSFKIHKASDLMEAKVLESVLKLEDGVVSSTPEKASNRLGCKIKAEEGMELSERYTYIVELFRQMSCSLRLLGLCKKSTTFSNVRPQVEILAKRKFSYKHLRQIKYILPEAVQIQKIIIHDEKSQCMKQDLKITLVFDVVKDHKQVSDIVALCRLFLSRVVDFSCTHPEGCDIPEAILLHSFSEDSESASSAEFFLDTSVVLNSGAVGSEPIEKVSNENTADQILNSKVTYSSANMMVETPAQLPPKRASIETDESLFKTSSNAVTLCEKPAKRSLDFNFETADRYVLSNTEGQPVHFRISQHERKKMGCKIPSNLRGCIPVIHQIFRSVDYSPITKQQLVFKILTSCLDIEERGVVEEHVEQLELLLPNWISKRISPSGDLMYSIKKNSDVSTLLAELQS